MFEIRFATSTFAPARSVTIRTPGNNWQAIPGEYLDGSWVFSLDETPLWSKPAYFKFFLDGEFWMDDPYIRIAPTEGGSYNFDESRVRFPMNAVTPPEAAAPAVVAPPAVVASPAVAAPAVAVPVVAPAVTVTGPIVNPTALISEGAISNRVVVLATPFLTAGAAWVAGVLARHVPGVRLDQTQVVSFMIAIVVVCLAGAWKWLQGWQQHELLVAQKLAAPIKAIILGGSTGNPGAQ